MSSHFVGNRHTVYKESSKLRDRAVIFPNDGTILDKVLYELLSLPTPYEKEERIHHLIPSMEDKIKDDKGNIIIRIGKPLVDFKTVFSCHMDTVHTAADAEKKLELSSVSDGPVDQQGMIFANAFNEEKQEYESAILGADDKLGVFVLLKLMEKKVPGMYIFHVGEERSGIGSAYIRDKHSDMLKGMHRAVAFDRMNYTDIIDWQRGGRCSSKKFGEALAKQLNELMRLPQLKFKEGISGSFTDTAHYREIIPECTNISVGYFEQHSKNEHFDEYYFQSQLLPAILKVDWEALPVDRDHKEVVTYPAYSTQHTTNKVELPKKINKTAPTKFIVRNVEEKDGATIVKYKVCNRYPLDAYSWSPHKALDINVTDEVLYKGMMKWVETATNEEIVKALVIAHTTQTPFGFSSDAVDWSKLVIPRANIILKFIKLYDDILKNDDMKLFPKFMDKNLTTLQNNIVSFVEGLSEDDVSETALEDVDRSIALISLFTVILAASTKGELRKYRDQAEELNKALSDFIVEYIG